MKTLLFTCLLATTSSLTAQSLTTTFAGGITIAPGGAVYFDLTCNHPSGIEISSLVLHFGDAAGTAGTVDLYVAPTGTSPLGNWIPIISGVTVTAAGPGAPTPLTFPTPSPMTMALGQSYRVAAVSTLQHTYTDGALPGNQLTYSNADLTLSAGEASASPFAVPVFSPRMVNGVIFYQGGGAALPLATLERLGNGCVEQFASAYEEFSSGTFDLTSFSMLRNGDGVAILPASVPPQPVFGVSLPLGDDDSTPTFNYGIYGAQTGMVVGSNGWVSLGSGNSHTATPNTNTMLNNPSKAYYAWRDLDPTSGGSIVYQETTWLSLPRIIVTYDGVPDFGSSNTNWIQFIFDFATLSSQPFRVTTHFGTVSPSGPMLVGYSPSGVSLDPGSSDFSNPLTTAPADAAPLQLEAAARPIQGASMQPFQLTTINVPTSAILHAGFIGLANPNLPLAVIGMPGCTQHASLDLILGPDVLPGSSVTWTALDLPALPPSFAGFEFYVQSLILGTSINSAFNGLGELTSNGWRCTVGTM